MSEQHPQDARRSASASDPRLDLRVSDAERNQVADELQRAAGDGRLDIDELEERLERAYAAKTYRDLQPLLFDLPSGYTATTAFPSAPSSAGSDVTPVGGRALHTRSQALLSETKRAGAWVVPRTYTVTAVLGNVHLDMTEAAFETTDATVVCTVLLGEVRILVRSDVSVLDETTPVLGEVKVKGHRHTAQPAPVGPTLILRGTVVLGSVTVQRPGTTTGWRHRWRHGT